MNDENDTCRALALAVFAELKAIPIKPADDMPGLQYESATLAGGVTDGMRLLIHWGTTWSKRGMLHLELCGWPQDSRGDQKTPGYALKYRDAVRGLPRPSGINVSISKGAPVIAGEVRRRLLAPAAPWILEARAVVAECDAYNGKGAASMARLAALGFETARHCNDEMYAHGNINGLHRLQVSGESVRFDAFSTDIDTAELFIKLMRERAAELAERAEL